MNEPYSYRKGGIATCATFLSGRVARVPSPLPNSAWLALYDDFDKFAEFVSSNSQYHSTFNDKAKLWQRESGLKLQYSGYFSPYFRNTIMQDGKDNKEIFQICEPYVRYLWENESALMQIGVFRRLVQGMMSVLYSSYATYLGEVNAIRRFDSALADALIPSDTIPSVAVRLLRYQSDTQFFTNPHVDKSALTVIDSPRDCRRLNFLRGLVNEQKTWIFARNTGARSSVGVNH